MSFLLGRYKETSSGCWEWIKATNKDGYGVLGFGGKTWLAHRLSFKLHNPLTSIAGKVVMHSCDNPRCINPAHLHLGTQQDNMADMKNKGRAAVLRGDKGVNTKLKVLEREKVRRLYSTGNYTHKELAAMFNVSPALICAITRKV